MDKKIAYKPLSCFLTEYVERNTNNEYKPVAVGKYGIRTRESIYTKELASDYSKNKLIFQNTLTVGMGSNQIDIGILTSNEIYSVSPAYHTYKINGINPKYLEYCLKYKNAEMFAKYSKRGARQGKSIELKKWLTYEIPVYNIEEQNKIVSKLNLITEIIECGEERILLYDELIKSKFIEMFGDLEKNNKNYLIVPFEEVIEYIGDIGSNGANKIISEHLDMKNEEDYALMVRFLNFTKNDFKNDVKYISKETYEFFKKSKIYGGELIICKIGSAGQSYIMPYLNRPVSLGLNQIMVRVKDIIKMQYLYYYLHTDYGEYLISKCIGGAVTKTVTKTKLKKLPILLPPLKEQKQFIEFEKMIKNLKETTLKRISIYSELRKKEMHKYFD